MAEKIGVEFEVKNKGANKAIKQTTEALGNFNKELDRSYQSMQVLDQITGGVASEFQDAQKSIKGSISAVKGLATGFKGLKTAIIATGIGAVVVALGLIVAYWDDIKELVSGVSAEQEALLKTQQDSVDASEMAFDAIRSSENTLKLQGKTERDILALKMQQTNETIAALEAQIITQEEIKKQQVATATRNRDILAGILAFIGAPINILLVAVDALTFGLTKLGLLQEGTNLAEGFVTGAAELLFDPEQIEEDGQAALDAQKKQLTKLKNQRDGFILQEKKLDEEEKKEEEEKKKEADDKKAEQALKDANARIAALQKIEDAENAYFESKMAKETLEKNAVQDKYFELIESAKKYNQDTTLLEKARTEKLAAIDKKYRDEEKAQDELLKDQKLALVGQTFGAIADILGKNSKAGKSAAIAAATINTYQGVTQVWKSDSVLPEPFGTIQKIASTATVLASGLAAVKKIKSTPKPEGLKGGTTTGGGAGGGISTPAPAFNIVGGSGTNQLADVIAEQTQKPVRSYVVAGDVTTAQEMERNTIDGASI